MKKLMDNNLFLKIISILIAIGLWLFVLYTVKPTTQKVYKNINVTFKGEYVLDGENLAILKDTSLTADVEIKGARVDVAKVNSKDITVSVNVENIKKAGSYSLDYNVKVAGNNITVLSVSPSSSNITIETKKEKNIPLSVKKVGSLPDKNEVLDADLLMDSIVISGPSSVINKVVKAVTIIDQNRVKDGQQIDLPYIFYDKSNKQIAAVKSIEPSYRQAKITCHILYKKSVNINPVTKGNPESSLSIDSINASPKTVTLIGPQNLIGSLTSIDTMPFNISGLSTAKTFENISLNLPSNVAVSGKSDTTNVIVNVGPSITQNIPITSLKTKNSSDQSRFEIEDALSVSVTGTASNIQNTNIVGTIDLANLKTGVQEVPVTFTSSNPYLAINGTYTVKINIIS